MSTDIWRVIWELTLLLPTGPHCHNFHYCFFTPDSLPDITCLGGTRVSGPVFRSHALPLILQVPHGRIQIVLCCVKLHLDHINQETGQQSKEAEHVLSKVGFNLYVKVVADFSLSQLFISAVNKCSVWFQFCSCLPVQEMQKPLLRINDD